MRKQTPDGRVTSDQDSAPDAIALNVAERAAALAHHWRRLTGCARVSSIRTTLHDAAPKVVP